MIVSSPLSREFFYSSIRLADPDRRLSPEEVRNFFSAQYPEIVTATITGPEAVGDKLRYTFTRAIGAKG